MPKYRFPQEVRYTLRDAVSSSEDIAVLHDLIRNRPLAILNNVRYDSTSAVRTLVKMERASIGKCSSIGKVIITGTHTPQSETMYEQTFVHLFG